jgi:hypothetical protein
LPADSSIETGNWDCASFGNLAHYVGAGSGLSPQGCTAAATISRFDIFRYELNYLNDRTPLGLSTAGRDGHCQAQ